MCTHYIYMAKEHIEEAEAREDEVFNRRVTL